MGWTIRIEDEKGVIVDFRYPARAGNNNPEVEYRVELAPLLGIPSRSLQG